MKDFNGRPIEVGSFVRHAYQPLPPKATAVSGLGYHAHNFFGIAQVAEVHAHVVTVRGGVGERASIVYLGALLEVVGGPICNEPYIMPLRPALLAMSETGG